MLVRRRASLRREPSQARSSFTFDAILDAAQQMILSEGTTALQMSMLAKRAGVSAGTMYQYFPDKTSVVMSLADRVFARFVSDVRRVFELSRSAGLDVLLEQISAALTESAYRDHPLRRALLPELDAAGGQGELVDLSEQAAAFVAQELRSRVVLPEERLLTLSRLVVWTADGLLEGAFRRAELSVQELRTALLFAWRGILEPARNANPDQARLA